MLKNKIKKIDIFNILKNTYRFLLTIIFFNTFIFIPLIAQDVQSLSGINQRLKTLSTLYKKFAPTIIASKFSQSQAHFSIDDIEKMINEYYPWYAQQHSLLKGDEAKFINKEVIRNNKITTSLGPLYKYRNVIKSAIEQEEKFKDTHYVFYHAQDYMFRIAQDLNFALCQLDGQCTSKTNFIFLRTFTPDFFNFPDINEWMDTKYKEWQTHKLIDPTLNFNNDPGVQSYVLAVNLSLFGNIARPDSNTFKFFLRSLAGIQLPMGRILNAIVSKYVKDIPQKANIITALYLLGIDIATNLQTPNATATVKMNDTIWTQEGQVLQIFIPKDMVDQTIFLTKEHGVFWPIKFPAIASWDSTKIHFPITSADYSTGRYTKSSPILETYVNNPEKLNKQFHDPGNTNPKVAPKMFPIKNIAIDRLEGRILLRGEIFNEPTKHNINMFRYTMLDDKREKEYKERIQIIAQYIHKMKK